MADRPLPAWAEEIKRTYLRGEASVFIVHGNVYDHVVHAGETTPLVDFLVKNVVAKKTVIAHFNPSIGIKFRKKERQLANLESMFGVKGSADAIAALDTLLLTQDDVAVLIDYAEEVIPQAENHFQLDDDRRKEVTVHRWTSDRRFEHSNNIIILVTEVLPELSNKLVSNAGVVTIAVPLPTEAEREFAVRQADPAMDDASVRRMASLSAGLKTKQVMSILKSDDVDSTQTEHAEKRAYILRLLSGQPNAEQRAETLAKKFAGHTQEEIKEILSPDKDPAPAPANAQPASRYEDVFKLLAQRKREILEKECFGLIEFVEPHHDFSAVGGMDGVKQELMNIAKNIREGNTTRVPMGLLFTGPMGTGKTFVAEAFAKSSGLTAIKLKNFRSKWVGSTEGNLEKILSVVKAIGNILVIIDEGDRAFGNAEGEGDGGTSSRIIARIKEFMSDTTNRGRVLFVLMTNRPDKLDIDIKRAGRLDRKIPFFYGQDADEIEPILKAQLRRHKVDHTLEWPRDRSETSEKLVGYSNADIEAVVLLANDLAQSRGSKVTTETFAQAVRDYLPSRDSDMLAYMELQAVFEASSRAMLPRRYADISPEELQARIAALKPRIR